MADELDPRLEARLRTALHAEADSLPFTVRGDDLERARRGRRWRRLAAPASLLGAAAVVAILVASGILGRGEPGIVAASPSTSTGAERPLVSYEILTGMLGIDPPALKAEHPVADQAGGRVKMDLGTIGPGDSVEFAIHCLGGGVDITFDDGGAKPDEWHTDCPANPFTARLPGTETAYRITVGADAGVRWRVVMAEGHDVPSPTSGPTTRELASYEDLAAYMSSTIEVLRNESTEDASPGTVEFGEVAGRFNLEVVLACTGTGEVSVSVRGGGATSPVGTWGCGGPGVILWTALEPALVTASQASLVVDAPEGTAWRMLVFDHSSALRGYPEVPALGFESALLGTMGGTMAAGETAPVEAPVVVPGATLVVAFGCEGQGLLHLVVDGIARDAACLASNVMEFVPAGTGASRLEITPDHAVRLNLELRSYTREQVGADFVAPTATLHDGAGPSSAPGYTSCLLAFAIPGGASADEGCGPAWRQVPEARAVRAHGVLELSLPTGWVLTAATAAYVDHEAIADDTQAATEASLGPDPDPGVEGTMTFPTPPAGDWAVRIDLSGRADDGTAFTAQQLFRVIVEP